MESVVFRTLFRMRKTDMKYTNMESSTAESRMSLSPLDRIWAFHPAKNFRHHSIIGRKAFGGSLVGAKGSPR